MHESEHSYPTISLRPSNRYVLEPSSIHNPDDQSKATLGCMFYTQAVFPFLDVLDQCVDLHDPPLPHQVQVPDAIPHELLDVVDQSSRRSLTSPGSFHAFSM